MANHDHFLFYVCHLSYLEKLGQLLPDYWAQFQCACKISVLSLILLPRYQRSLCTLPSLLNPLTSYTLYPAWVWVHNFNWAYIKNLSTHVKVYRSSVLTSLINAFRVMSLTALTPLLITNQAKSRKLIAVE